MISWKIEWNGKRFMHGMVRIRLFRHRDWLRSYTFFNTSCLFYKQFKYKNRTDFQNAGACEYCSALEYYTPCLAQTYTTFSNDKEVTANHCAHWNWAAKKISRLSSEIVRNAITRDCSTITRAIQSTSIIVDLGWCKKGQKVKNKLKNQISSQNKVK